MGDRPVLLWLRNDLRLSDNRALAAAIATGAAVIPVFILDDISPKQWKRGGASRWWLGKSLAALGRDIEQRGNALVFRSGESLAVLSKLCEETRASAVFFSRCYEPWAATLEARVHAALTSAGVETKRYGGALLKEPEDIRSKTGDVYKVYTPFWRALSTDLKVAPPLPAPDVIAPWKHAIKSDTLKSWHLQPSKPDWSVGMAAEWQPGEAGARARLTAFLATALKGYADDRNRPDIAATSRLSPHLHFGEITPAQCWCAADAAAADQPGSDKGHETFLKELVWREFSYTLLHNWPDLPEKPFRPEFAAYPWSPKPKFLKAWQKGQTGYPIVDAGMRQLWQTGYMHNRVRMIVASFLIKHLRISWQDGQAWFWDTLCDADLANNAASWQWVAGSGADAAPYFRIFNPITQGLKFDTAGDYVRRFVPEIAALPAEYIHAPWDAPADVLARANVSLGSSYPERLVDHAQARDAAMAGYDAVKLAAAAAR